MSALSHTDRMTIASGGVIGGSNMGSQMKMNSESRTFSPSWAIGPLICPQLMYSIIFN